VAEAEASIEEHFQMNDQSEEFSQEQPQEFKLPAKPIGRAGAAPMAIIPETMDDIYRMSKVLLASGMAPYHLKKPEEVTVIIMHGLELGMKPMMAVRRIAVIKGTPTIWGDAVPGLCLATGELEDWREWVDGEGDAKTWHCEVKRKGVKSPKVATFSIAQAKKADLWDERTKITKRGKNGNYEADNDTPWFRHTERMMAMRARVAFRDIFADVFNGLYIAEELIDKDTQLDESGMRDVTPAKETWKTVDNPLGDDPKVVEVEPKNGKRSKNEIEGEGQEVRIAQQRALDGKPDEPVTRYFHDPESGSVWESSGAEQLGGGVEEVDRARYDELVELYAKAKAEAEAEEAKESDRRHAQAELQAAQKAEEARRKAAGEAKATETTPEPQKAKDAPAKPAGAPPTGSAYYVEALATVSNAVDPGKLNQWWRAERTKRLKECTASELEQLNAIYSDKFVELSKG
jgi:hypothetical protein